MTPPRTLLLKPRSVPLGGLRAMDVQRTLPHRDIPTIGPWCFLDRFGPQHVDMRVDPHPHIGLQTVTWPLSGVVRHRDSVGSDVNIGRGQLNLMTSGNGISHSEYSRGQAPLVDALQFWVALPDDARFTTPRFEQHEKLPRLALATTGTGEHATQPAEATVILGTLGEVTSPASTYSPMVGAEITVAAGETVTVPLNAQWEHGLFLIDGAITATGLQTSPPEHLTLPTMELNDLAYVTPGIVAVTIEARQRSRLFLIGGEPFAEDLVMWWNFVARTHEEIVIARNEWQAKSERFGRVDGHGETRIPAPPLPEVRLTPRRRKR